MASDCIQRPCRQRLGISELTVRRTIGRGELPATLHAGVYRISPGNLALMAQIPCSPKHIIPA